MLKTCFRPGCPIRTRLTGFSGLAVSPPREPGCTIEMPVGLERRHPPCSVQRHTRLLYSLAGRRSYTQVSSMHWRGAKLLSGAEPQRPGGGREPSWPQTGHQSCSGADVSSPAAGHRPTKASQPASQPALRLGLKAAQGRSHVRFARSFSAAASAKRETRARPWASSAEAAMDHPDLNKTKQPKGWVCTREHS